MTWNRLTFAQAGLSSLVKYFWLSFVLQNPHLPSFYKLLLVVTSCKGQKHHRIACFELIFAHFLNQDHLQHRLQLVHFKSQLVENSRAAAKSEDLIETKDFEHPLVINILFNQPSKAKSASHSSPLLYKHIWGHYSTTPSHHKRVYLQCHMLKWFPWTWICKEIFKILKRVIIKNWQIVTGGLLCRSNPIDCAAKTRGWNSSPHSYSQF